MVEFPNVEVAIDFIGDLDPKGQRMKCETDMDWTQQWLDLVAPDEPHKFRRRLSWSGFSEEEFHAWLAAGPNACQDNDQAWSEALQRCKEWLKKDWDQPLQPVQLNEQRPFIDLWTPIRDGAAECLKFDLSNVSSLERIAPGVIDQLADSLLNRLVSLGEQVLWDQFNASRTPGAMLIAHLGMASDGEGPPTRALYTAFIQSLRHDGLHSLLLNFPVLGRLIGTVVDFWRQGSLEMLQRVQHDRSTLEARFSIPNDWTLCSVQQGLSDPHRGGRAVAVLGFEAEDSTRRRLLVYKPKDMRVDAAYQVLLEEMNSQCDLPPLRSLIVHAADGYGYMEYVPHQLCKDAAELRRFYQNAGRLTSLLHLIGCTDCHHENLVACADQLVLIDTETLLEADLCDHIQQPSESSESQHPSALHFRLQGSVLRSGLLPQWSFVGQERQAVDISALGISPPEKTERLVNGWLGINSDGMMPGRVTRQANCPTSLPVGIGASNPFPRFLNVFCEGFRLQANKFVGLKVRWQAADGPLGRFSGLPRRIVLRPTYVYTTLQRQQLEGSALRSEQAQMLRLEQLARSYLLAEEKPPHWSVLAAERQQMQCLDIPFFSHPIDQDSLELDNHGTMLTGLIKVSGLRSAWDRLKNLNEAEIAFQERLIRGSVEARILKELVQPMGGLTAETGSDAEQRKCEMTGLEAASRIAERLCDMAIRDPQGHVDWLGMNLGADGNSFSFGPVGLSLYSGSIGIACLLDRLKTLGNAPDDTERLQAAILQPLRRILEQPQGDGRRRWWRDQSLGLSGCGGVLLALSVLDQQDLAEALLQEALPRFIEADRKLDLIGGCAGLIGALLRLNTPNATALAAKAAQHLVDHQNASGAWSTKSRQQPLLGFSHGTAGFAVALAHMHARSGEEAFIQAARAALDYERARFDSNHGNWPDFRGQSETGAPAKFMVSWCHGAPGIGLARACLWGTDLWDDHCAEEIGTALRTTAAKSIQGPDHLCCGRLGLMLVLQYLATGPWSLEPEVRRQAIAVATKHRNQVVDRCAGMRLDLRCFGTSEGDLMLPGFFTGLSGMGLALLEDSVSQTTTLTLISAGMLQTVPDTIEEVNKKDQHKVSSVI